MIGLAATAIPLGAAVAALGVVSTAGAAVMYRYIPRYSPWPGVSNDLGAETIAQGDSTCGRRN